MPAALAVPCSVGVVSSTLRPLAKSPMMLPVSSVPWVMVADGDSVSTVNLTLLPQPLRLPASSTALTPTCSKPSASAGTVKLQLPLASARTLPSRRSFIPYSSTITLGSAVPWKVGVLSSMTLPEMKLAVAPPASSIALVMVGAFGAIASEVTGVAVASAVSCTTVLAAKDCAAASIWLRFSELGEDEISEVIFSAVPWRKENRKPSTHRHSSLCLRPVPASRNRSAGGRFNPTCAHGIA